MSQPTDGSLAPQARLRLRALLPSCARPGRSRRHWPVRPLLQTAEQARYSLPPSPASHSPPPRRASAAPSPGAPAGWPPPPAAWPPASPCCPPARPPARPPSPALPSPSESRHLSEPWARAHAATTRGPIAPWLPLTAVTSRASKGAGRTTGKQLRAPEGHMSGELRAGEKKVGGPGLPRPLPLAARGPLSERVQEGSPSNSPRSLGGSARWT